MPENNYEVICGNVGTVHRGNRGLQAYHEFVRYRDLSKNSPDSHAYKEEVTLIKNGEVEIHYLPGVE